MKRTEAMQGSEQNKCANTGQERADGQTQIERIRRMNDAFRRGQTSGRIMVTPGIHDLGPEVVAELVLRIAAYDAFSVDNDPYGEHDFGCLSHQGQKVFWKIDYYDRSLETGSPNPANPDITTRVMTIMLASEY
jgi:hypothetical protein